MISSVTTSLAALAELPAAPGDTPGASASLRTRPPMRLGSSHGVAAVAVAAGAKVAKATAAKPKPKPKPKAKAASTGAGYAKAAASTSKTAAKATKADTAQKKAGPLGFLDDPKLSVEDKLLKLLAYLNDKWNKDLDAKMKEFKTEKEKATASTSSSSSSSSKKSSGLGGLVGKAVGFVKQALPAAGVALEALGTPAVRSALKSVAGPALAALATSTGFPQLAPAALKFGPELVDAAAGLASSSGSGEEASPVAAVANAVGGSGTSTSTSTTQTANPLGSDRDAQLKLMEIQRIMDQQKEMFSLVSNLLRTGHEGRMGIIQNLRA